MKWPILGLIFLGFCAALSSALLTASFRLQDVQADKPKPISEVTVLVASRSLRPSTLVEADVISSKTLPVSHLPDEPFYSDPTQIIGKMLVMPMLPEQPFLKRCFAADGPGADVALRLAAGMRAVSISLPQSSALKGLLYPGCHVDVLVTFDTGQRDDDGGMGEAMTTTLIENIKVLAVEERTLGQDGVTTAEPINASSKINTMRQMVTLMVDAAQAEALQLGVERGSLSLALRNPVDDRAEGQREPDAMVLSEGRIERMTEMMRRAREREAARLAAMVTPTPTPTPEPTPAPVVVHRPAPQPKPVWNIDIIRGVEVEQKTYPLSKD